MSSNCTQCSEYIQRDEHIEECCVCMEDFCTSCMNGQYSCEECLEVERNSEEEES